LERSIVTSVVLVFAASPLVALPPVVLPETLALPDVAVCELVLLMLMELVFVTVVVLVLLKFILLVEFGPVLLMSPVSLLTASEDTAPLVLLLTVSDAVKELSLEATPELASPPVVLPETLALPVEADCGLLFETLRLLLLVTVCEVELWNLTRFVELGPVVPIEAELAPAAPASPPARLRPVATVAAILTNLFILVFLPLFKLLFSGCSPDF
jgi:hypothetical protein